MNYTPSVTIKLPKSRTGVYLFKNKGKIVYIGKAKDVIVRIGQHRRKTFDEIEIIWDSKWSFRTEYQLIRKYKPRLNLALLSDKRLLRANLIPRGIPVKKEKVKVVNNELAGAIVRRRREKAKITQDELAEKLKICPALMSRLENGRANWNQERFDEAIKLIHK